MIATKKIWSVLTIALVLGLGIGCDLGTSTAGDDVYSYNVDEIAPGLFGSLSPTMTMNEWCRKVTQPSKTYDEVVRDLFTFYKDENLETPFTSTDILDENTVIYCKESLNGQGKKIGEITGTITLTDISNPATSKVYLGCFGSRNSKWWWANRKIDISEVIGTSATLNWSLPVYESFGFGVESAFEIIILSGDSLKSYEVSVPTKKTISNANANVGDLGTVSIKGVPLSGTITVTHDGQPVPYVEIYANFPGWGTLGITCLSSPEPNTPWSLTFGPNPNDHIGVEFRIYYYSGKNGSLLFYRDIIPTPPVYIDDNQGVSGIVLDVPEW